MTNDLDIPDFLRRLKGEMLKPKGVLLSNRELVEREQHAKQAIEDEAPEQELSFDKKYVPTVQERLREKVSATIGEIEGLFDDGLFDESYDFYEFLTILDATKPIATMIGNHFEPVAAELLEALSSNDPDLKEGYRHYSKDDLMKTAVIYQSLVDDCYRYADLIKKERKTRTKKAPSIERQLKGFKFAIKNDKWKIASVEPSKIIGAQELWTFNVTNQVMTVYRALSGGLAIKGPHIENIDETSSQSKRVGRRTEEKIRAVLEGGKVSLRKFFDSVNGQSLPLTRIGKNVILLRIIKI